MNCAVAYQHRQVISCQRKQWGDGARGKGRKRLAYHFGQLRCSIVNVYLFYYSISTILHIFLSLVHTGKNRVFNWALNAAEDCVARAVTTAAPIVNRLDRPIAYVDQTLVKGIAQLETKAPIIKDTPQEIYTQAKNKVIDVVQPHLERVVKFKAAGQQKASSLKDLAWQKANEVLATQYGSLAVNGVDTTTALAERLLEYYFPKCDTDVEEDNGKQRYFCIVLKHTHTRSYRIVTLQGT